MASKPDILPMDCRRYFMLPQGPEDGGYYVYGDPGRGVYQYAHSKMIVALLQIAWEWQSMDARRFGVGDISLADGVKSKLHATHSTGLEVDIRPLRKDGAEVGVLWYQQGYDHDATNKLIELFYTYAPVDYVLFNDPEIFRTKPARNHDNHFHVKMRA